ncbi:hypothetical protein G5714_019443 [Onychostoma macrolepis]|uniref:Uncharacterized protein n=1 Tax=Onychostoma macrolepis TaxID=369639 RepID=A0A7J6BWE9_9TELE|nr:hypothetical protein G5714_019443 [Onychostoma macrolepis]
MGSDGFFHGGEFDIPHLVSAVHRRLNEFITLDDGHTEPESLETHISAVGAVRPPKRRLCVGATQAEDARFVAIRRFNWLRTGEAIASHSCPSPKLIGTQQGKRRRVRCSV